jgi:putative hydrolase of the HAD superfamily
VTYSASDYRALIVDFGGVLTTPLQNAFVAFASEMEIDLDVLVRVALGAYAGAEDELVFQFETGQIPESEFGAAFAQRLGEETGKEVDPDGIVTRMLSGLRLEDDMVEAVRLAKAAGLKTALCSNSWGTGGYPRELLEEICDVVVISGEVGLRKPDPAIFEMTVEKLGVAAEASVFVDDHPGHLKAAQGAGMTTVLHRDPAQSIAELEGLLGISLS